MNANLKYADEDGFGHSLSIARWKPITLEVFAQRLHQTIIDNCSEYGNGGLWGTKARRVGKLQTVTVYYAHKRKPGDSTEEKAVSGIPILATLTIPGNKVLCMEYVEEPYDHFKPLEVNREAFLRG